MAYYQSQLQLMPAPAAPTLPGPITVLGPQYCAPYPVDLTIVSNKVFGVGGDNFAVKDINGNVIFKVKSSLMTLRDHRLLLDAAGNPIVTLRRKLMTAHDRWQAFRGDSKDPTDLIFTLKRSSLIQLKTKLDVFLASNTNGDTCDFKIKGSWVARSCAIYAGDSNSIVAQMHQKHNVQSVLLGKDSFMVTVYPNIDYAFIVALMVVLNEINEDDNGK
ncbi:hypothetical protein RIF29_00245 [Crotalaria pallida]|uniref:Uncharacterized protein n=1 Tax=Crotalaria pallida TaxID=3830 RepID=A0AAN9IWF8_CROPI